MKVRNNIDHCTGRLRLIGAACITLAVALMGMAPAADAETPKPHWSIISIPAPSHFQAGDEGDFFEVIAVNDGAASTDGSKITVEDTLPPEVTATKVESVVVIGNHQTLANPMNCPTDVTCETSEIVPVGEVVIVKITVSVGPNPPSKLLNSATISGGGAGPATAARAATVSSAPVPFGATLATDASDEAGGLDSEAGTHPVGFTTMLDLNISAVEPAGACDLINQFGTGCPLLNANSRDLNVELPPGLVGNPTAVPTCKQTDFQEYGVENCPVDTQVGVGQFLFYGRGNTIQYGPIYNLEAPPGQPAELGFSVGNLYHIPIFFHLRSDGDYGLTAQLRGISEADSPRVGLLTIWGVPASPIHDPQRAGIGCDNRQGCPSGILLSKPFLTLPTSCASPSLPVSALGDSWQETLAEPFPLLSSATLPGMTGCNQLEFEPKLEARPTTNLADSPSGLHVDLKVPQNEDPEGTAEAHLKEAVLTLPKGLTVNPSSANGREGCSPAQIGLKTEEGATPIHFSADPAECPDASKLGTVEVDTPLLKERNEAGEPTSDHPLPGAVYLATPYDNPFKSLLAIYITVNDPKTGVVVKLAGKVEIAADGQLTTTVTENPQFPFEDFKLDFFGGARAPLRTPAPCGSYETTSVLTPWSAPESGPPATPSDPYQISSGPNGHACASTEAAEPNQPSFEAGTEKPIAAAYSPFSLHLHREDGSQVFKALNVTLPPGLIGKLAGVGECPDAQLAAAAAKTGAAEQASPSCPASSHLGTANVGAGAGTSPYYVTGQAYLAGPYKGAPLSVAIVTPAVAGPFDLGTVVVRSALHVNPETAQVSVTSDPIPTELQGIQLDIRSIDLKLDRSQFILNPTNCERMAVGGEAISSLSQVASLTNPFQVGECGRLRFKPKLSLKLSGKTHRTGHPSLRAELTMPSGGANIARAQVTLPHSEFLDQAHIGTVCTRVQFAAHACPLASVYGHATATTPLLDQPLSGPVYLRSSSHKLPDLVADLNGQIEVTLDGKIDTGKGGGIRNTFEVVPDAPVSKFVLSMQGGKKGLLVNSENLCSPHAKTKALAHFVAQNGKLDDFTPTIANDCGKKGKGKKKGRTHR